MVGFTAEVAGHRGRENIPVASETYRGERGRPFCSPNESLQLQKDEASQLLTEDCDRRQSASRYSSPPSARRRKIRRASDLNDAPAGIAVDEQINNRRELPLAGGIIDLPAFLATLVELNYDAPIRAEPFNESLNQLEDEPTVEATSVAMQKSFSLVE